MSTTHGPCTKERILICKLDMEEMHAYYINNVSNNKIPISLELSNYLYDLCKKIRPAYILDSGSGFSSFVFRKYKIMTPSSTTRVITIDHSLEWLNKTKNFLRYCGIVPEDCWPTNHYMVYANLFKFDLIFEDYYFRDRGKILTYDVTAVKDDGIIIVDDAHLPHTRSLMWYQVKKNNMALSYLKGLKDSFGRYPGVLKKKSKR